MVRKFFYFLPLILLTMSTLSGCTESEEDKAPKVEKIDDEDLVNYGWKWAIRFDNYLRMQASPDIRNGGYFAQIDDMDSYDAIFMFDDKCRLSQACINRVWYYFFTQGSKMYVSYCNDTWTHSSFDFQYTNPTGTNAFEKMAAYLKAVYKTVSFLPKPATSNLNDIFAGVSRGKYNTSSAPDNDEAMQQFCETAYYYEDATPTLRKDLFYTYMFVHYAHERTGDYNQIGIMASPIHNTTFIRDYNVGNYGDEIENKVYCGLVFGTSPEVTLNNCEYVSKLVPLDPVDDYVWVDVPENMEHKTYYVRAFMVSEQEKKKVEQGEYIHPHLVYYEQGCPDSMEKFYNSEMQIDNINVTIESVINRVLTVNLTGELSLPGELSGEFHEALYLKTKPLGEKSYTEIGMVDPGNFNKHIYVDRRDFKELDTENFVARGEWELAVYAGWVCIGKVPFTIVYDKKPSIRYTDFSSDGTKVKYKRIYEGAFWFDDNVLGMMEYSKGSFEYFSSFAIDTTYDDEEDIDDTGLISHQLKATGAYMQTTVNGKVLKSNRLVYVRDADGKRINIYLE